MEVIISDISAIVTEKSFSELKSKKYHLDYCRQII